MKVAEKKCLIITPVSVPSKLKKKQKSLWWTKCYNVWNDIHLLKKTIGRSPNKTLHLPSASATVAFNTVLVQFHFDHSKDLKIDNIYLLSLVKLYDIWHRTLFKGDSHSLRIGRWTRKITSMTPNTCTVTKILAGIGGNAKILNLTLRSNRKTNHIWVYTFNNTEMTEVRIRRRAVQSWAKIKTSASQLPFIEQFSNRLLTFQGMENPF